MYWDVAIHLKFLHKSSLHSPGKARSCLYTFPKAILFQGRGRGREERRKTEAHYTRRCALRFGGSMQSIDWVHVGRGEPGQGLETEGLRARWLRGLRQGEARPAQGATSPGSRCGGSPGRGGGQRPERPWRGGRGRR